MKNTVKNQNSKTLELELETKRSIVNSALIDFLENQLDADDVLKDAIRYTLNAPGKRIRGSIVLWGCEMICGTVKDEAITTATAIEMIHTYSLIHDDLPCMDNDDFRRGLPTCHKKFDEATAVLTGDALLTMAFGLLAKEIADANLAVKLIGQLAQDAGVSGMIAGQVADLQAENTKGDKATVEYIHLNKTAKMFRCSAMCGGLCGGADTNQLRMLNDYGLNIGLGFQIADDILDICATSEQLGKTAGKDEKASKCTYPAVEGLEKSKHLARQISQKAVKSLDPFGEKAKTLQRLAVVLQERTK